MGQKIKSTTSLAEEEEGVEVKLIPGETKRVAGYLCKKAIIKQKDMPDTEVYYSEELKSSGIFTAMPQFKKLKGIPLEYQIRQQGMTMRGTASEVVKKSLDDSVFNPPAGDYQEAPDVSDY